MYLLDLPLIALAILGYTGIVVHTTNRLRATSISRHLVGSLSDFLLMSVLAIGPLAIVIYFLVLYIGNLDPTGGPLTLRWSTALIFFVPCWGFAFVVLPIKLILWLGYRRSDKATSSNVRLLDLADQNEEGLTSGWKAKVANRFFNNQVTLLETSDVRLDIPRLDPAFEGLTITHLSDLHYTGRFKHDYYRQVVAIANEKESDLIVVTGDIIDRLDKISWLGDTLGQLRAKYGVYFILGNHDYEFKAVDKIRQSLIDAGLKDLGGQAQRVEVADGQGVLLLAGNERPWSTAPTSEAIQSKCLDEKETPILKVLLSHSPDQLSWAREHDFNLMLAGHTHGGQICLPLWGPLICPSKYGLRYVSGCYYESPTLLYVTRGVCGETPIRINCPPQLPRYVLK